MFYITFRDEDGNWYWGGTVWLQSRKMDGVRYFNTRAYAERIARDIEASMTHDGTVRGRVKAREVKGE